MKALLIPVFGEPREINLQEDENGSVLHALQKAVNGYIESFAPLFEDAPTLWINEEGAYICPANRAVYATASMEKAGYISQIDGCTVVEEGDLYTILFGDIIATGFDPETGASRDISSEEIRRVTDYFTTVSPAGTGTMELMKMQRYRAVNE